jgi:PleD family two-component response regulator
LEPGTSARAKAESRTEPTTTPRSGRLPIGATFAAAWESGACEIRRTRRTIPKDQYRFMPSLTNINIYLAIRKEDDRSSIVDQLVLDGADVSAFTSARELWDRFQERPARFVVTDRRFAPDFDGMELVRKIRKHYQLPYIYVLMRSRMGQLKEIKEGLELGVDDYLVYPHNPFQIRSRVLVGLRWLTYLDSITWKSRGSGSGSA